MRAARGAAAGTAILNVHSFRQAPAAEFGGGTLLSLGTSTQGGAEAHFKAHPPHRSAVAAPPFFDRSAPSPPAHLANAQRCAARASSATSQLRVWVRVVEAESGPAAARPPPPDPWRRPARGEKPPLSPGRRVSWPDIPLRRAGGRAVANAKGHAGGRPRRRNAGGPPGGGRAGGSAALGTRGAGWHIWRPDSGPCSAIAALGHSPN